MLWSAAVLWFGLLTLALPSSPVRAETPPRSNLRQRLQAVQTSHAVGQGALHSIAYTLDLSERLQNGRYRAQANALAEQAKAYLQLAESGQDPFPLAKGEIVMRGYPSRVSTALQGYAVYVPPGYDPARRYPLMVMLHGGSANGNLFLGVVLGNNMNWKTYREHLWDRFTPRWQPDWIIVAPDGFGQVMWRFMGEQDVLDVLDDVQKNYNIDTDRVVLGGLSNGGVGAYNLGARHAHRFAAVMAIAGAPSWMQYAAAPDNELHRRLLYPLSGMQLAENYVNTDFRYYHGRQDGGPMKPRYVEAFERHLDGLRLPNKGTWYDAGHDLLYLVHRHGRIYDQLDGVRRVQKPREVRLRTGDYRAARQHWLEVTRIANYPSVARLDGRWEGSLLQITSDGARAFNIDLQDSPAPAGTITIEVNDKEVCRGHAAEWGPTLHIVQTSTGFRRGAPIRESLEKRPGVSGPITDAYFDSMVHVYGTGDPEAVAQLRGIAEKGARGSPLWLWQVQQPVVADTEVTPQLMRDNHLVLYGRPGDNRVLDRLAKQLPIAVTHDQVRLRDRTISGPDVGTKYIYPNPEAPHRYVIVQSGVSLAAVAGGHSLPDFLPDYVVYDRETVRRRPRLLFPNGRRGPRTQGFFDDDWQLPVAPDDTASPTGHRLKPEGSTGAVLLTAPHGQRAPSPATGVVPRGPALRERVSHGSWRTDRRALWQPQPPSPCLTGLRQTGIPAVAYEGPTLTGPVAAPVELRGPVGGIWFRSTHEERPVLLSCEMASRLPDLARVLRAHGVRGVDVMSSYRPLPVQSYHRQGLALDLFRFFRLQDVLSVQGDFVQTPNRATCDPPALHTASRPSADRGLTLKAIACALAASGRFSTILTPNYNRGHHDHLHLDIRPADNRVFIR